MSCQLSREVMSAISLFLPSAMNIHPTRGHPYLEEWSPNSWTAYAEKDQWRVQGMKRRQRSRKYHRWDSPRSQEFPSLSLSIVSDDDNVHTREGNFHLAYILLVSECFILSSYCSRCTCGTFASKLSDAKLSTIRCHFQNHSASITFTFTFTFTIYVLLAPTNTHTKSGMRDTRIHDLLFPRPTHTWAFPTAPDAGYISWFRFQVISFRR